MEIVLESVLVHRNSRRLFRREPSTEMVVGEPVRVRYRRYLTNPVAPTASHSIGRYTSVIISVGLMLGPTFT